MAKEETVSTAKAWSVKDPPAPAIPVVSFFAGCGGLDLGFEGGFDYRGEHYPAHPFEVIAAYELDKSCEVTYQKNLHAPFHLCDLSKADVSRMPRAQVLLGGFPCQEYSICGPKGGVQSKRGELFRAMSRYAKHWKPALVLAENVAHLPRLNGGEDLAAIKRSFKHAGYRCALWRLHAADYGVPQARDRIALVFVRDDIPADPLPPVRQFAGAPRTVEWAIKDLVRVKTESVPNQSQYFKAGLAKNGHGQGDEISPREAPGYTVRANAKSRVQFHYSLPRRLTVRECARLQTFPDSFEFPHSATTNIHQIGNAVPPVLAHALAGCLAGYLPWVEMHVPKRSRDGKA